MQDLPNVIKTRRSIFLLWMIALLLGAVYPNVGYLKKQLESSNGKFSHECNADWEFQRFIQVGDDNQHIIAISDNILFEGMNGVCGTISRGRDFGFGNSPPASNSIFHQREASQVIYFR
jgi:hypothetical protein